MLTPRQQQRVGSKYTVPGTDALFDTGIMLGDLPFVGTDHVFRFGSQRMEAFSGMLLGLHRLLAEKDLQGFQAALPEVLDEWSQRRRDAEADWAGMINMDTDGAMLGLRPAQDANPSCMPSLDRASPWAPSLAVARSRCST